MYIYREFIENVIRTWWTWRVVQEIESDKIVFSRPFLNFKTYFRRIRFVKKIKQRAQCLKIKSRTKVPFNT